MDLLPFECVLQVGLGREKDFFHPLLMQVFLIMILLDQYSFCCQQESKSDRKSKKSWAYFDEVDKILSDCEAAATK